MNQIAVIEKQLAAQKTTFQSLLPAQVSPRKFLRSAVTALEHIEKVEEVNAESVVKACKQAAGDGLVFDGKEAALVMFNKNVGTKQNPIWEKHATYVPMFAGILKTVRNSGEVSKVATYVVYQNDHFKVKLGLDQTIDHIPNLDNPGELRAAYAIAQMKDGTVQFEVMTRDEIMKVAKSSKSGWDAKANKLKGIWAQWESEMWRKTVLKRLCKYLPSSADLDDMITRDNEADDLEIDITPDIVTEKPAAAPPKKKSTKAAKAITQQAEKNAKPEGSEDVQAEPAAKEVEGEVLPAGDDDIPM